MSDNKTKALVVVQKGYYMGKEAYELLTASFGDNWEYHSVDTEAGTHGLNDAGSTVAEIIDDAYYSDSENIVAVVTPGVPGLIIKSIMLGLCATEPEHHVFIMNVSHGALELA